MLLLLLLLEVGYLGKDHYEGWNLFAKHSLDETYCMGQEQETNGIHWTRICIYLARTGTFIALE